jgi:hypothetical protein
VYVNTLRKEIVMKLRTVRVVPFLVAALMLGAAQVVLAQVDWTYIDPVVPPGPPGSWDSYRHIVGDVVFDGTTYHMYLLGGQTFLPWDSPFSVGHWTAPDLAGPWEEDLLNNPVVEPGPPGTWDSFSIYSVAVLYDGGVFKMWYGAAAAFPDVIGVGYAESLDGSTWTKYAGNPLPSLAPGAPGEWDDRGMDPSTVLFDGAEYRMWYIGVKADGGAGTWRLGTAASPDGLTWTKHLDPVLVGSLPWEGDFVYYPEVVPTPGGYAMWYAATADGYAAIGYAVSPDGIHWGRWPGNPVLSPLPGCTVVDSIAVIVEGDTVHGWATNCNDVWYVTSPLEVVFFDAFETGDCAIWSSMLP